jgi:predicted nucleic acid binding AN1-type Zn finger protein
MRELLDLWGDKYSENFRVIYCIGSRWANVHMGAKTRTKKSSEYVPPPPPKDFETLKYAEHVCRTSFRVRSMTYARLNRVGSMKRRF